jgi:regulatory protein
MPQENKQKAYVFTSEEGKRATEKAMALLQFKDRTEKELSERLYRAGFSENASLEAMQYVKNFGYINDRRYVENYLLFQKEKRSKKELAYKLAEKGIKKELLSQIMEESGYEGEETAAKKMVEKKLKGRTMAELSPEEKDKITAYLGRKGYKFETIRSVFSQLDKLP